MIAKADDEKPVAQPLDQASNVIATTKAYVEQFFPLWFTYHQSLLARHNELVGPDRVSPIYHAVVAINDDTLYASTVVDLSAGPVILTVPETAASYSVLTLDTYGNVFESGLPSKSPGSTLQTQVYGLVPANYAGTLPSGASAISLPFAVQFLIFRVDKFAPDGTNQLAQATDFRAKLKLQPLSDYVKDPAGGAARIVPELAAGVPFKTIADTLVRQSPVEFLNQLQTAVHSDNTPPLTEQAQAISKQFDAVFGATGPELSPADRAAFSRGAQAAHAAILDNYFDKRGRTQWIHFTNIGKWGDAALDRDSITEFIQYANDISAAAYYHTFHDAAGEPLDGSVRSGYVLTFPAGGQPEAKRFWSLTAYTPNAIELIPNSANKYVVARYTPGLEANSDGSVSIYISQTKPDDVPEANWLPVSNRPFNLMLRVYGVEPDSSVAKNTYVPPAVVRRASGRPASVRHRGPAPTPERVAPTVLLGDTAPASPR